MDKRRSAPRSSGELAGASSRAARLASEQQTPTVVDPARADAFAARRAGAGRRADPEPTEEIVADEADGDSTRSSPRPVRALRLPPRVLEPTQPVHSEADRGIAPARVLPKLRRLLSRDRERVPDAVDSATVDAPSPTPPGSLTKGAVLADRYVIVEDVEDFETGGMALVLKALDRQRERAGSARPWVALKVARSTGTNGTDTSGNLREEFLKLSELRHPNIVAVYDFGSDRGVDFMVLEWLRGQTLAQMLERLNSRRMALRTAEEIVRSVAGALAHAHAAGIVHGDVKPSNVFITQDHTVKLLDFGASTRGGPASNLEDGHGWATRAYATCHVLQGKPPRPCDDVFALGVTAYRLLAGERPFGELDALAARAEGAVPAALPEDAQTSWPAVRTALQLDDMDRHPDAAAFLRQLDEEPEHGREAVFPRPVPAHLTAIAWGALAVLLLASSIWWSMPAQTPPEVEALLEDAAAAMAGGRLLEPAGDNAFSYYSAVLETNPDDAEAGSGLDRIAEHFLDEARTALTAEQFESAAASLDRARRVRPDHFGIAPIEDLVARYRRDLLVSAQRAAETDIDVAERFLAQAAALSGEDDAEIVGARSWLERQRTAREVDALVRAIDERILSERLLVPAGDSAVDLLRRAAGVSPDDRHVQLARDRIASALLFQAMFSISNGDLDDAQSYIDAAKGLGVRHLALARAEYELARARNEAVRAGDAGTDT